MDNQIIVIKYGGKAMGDEKARKSFAKDISLLKKSGIKIIIVHGGGNEITEMCNKLNIPVKFINGLRFTDKATLEIVKMVLIGKINKDLVSLLNKYNVNALGLSGVDGRLFTARKYSSKKIDLGFVGKIQTVNTKLIFDLLSKEYVPVISSVSANSKSNFFNINADDVASEIATTLKADKLIYISDVKGIEFEGYIISKIDIRTAKELIRKGVINNGMIPKILSAFNSLNSGVNKIYLLNGILNHSLYNLFYNNILEGTEISVHSGKLNKLNNSKN